MRNKKIITYLPIVILQALKLGNVVFSFSFVFTAALFTKSKCLQGDEEKKEGEEEEEEEEEESEEESEAESEEEEEQDEEAEGEEGVKVL